MQTVNRKEGHLCSSPLNPPLLLDGATNNKNPTTIYS